MSRTCHREDLGAPHAADGQGRMDKKVNRSHCGGCTWQNQQNYFKTFPKRAVEVVQMSSESQGASICGSVFHGSYSDLTYKPGSKKATPQEGRICTCYSAEEGKVPVNGRAVACFARSCLRRQAWVDNVRRLDGGIGSARRWDDTRHETCQESGRHFLEDGFGREKPRASRKPLVPPPPLPVTGVAPE